MLLLCRRSARPPRTPIPLLAPSCGARSKTFLGNAENYNVEESNDTLMTAAYKVKHNVHVTVTGAVLQRTNHVALVSKGTECEMQVKSNYSGFEHDDSGDFRKRVEESFAKLQGSKPAEPAKPADAPK